MERLAADFLLLPSLMHFLHLIGAIAWIGGMVFTSLIVAPVLRREVAGPERLRLVQLVGQRFRVLEGIAFTFLIASGLYKVVQLGHDFDWTGSATGRILLLKLHLVVAVVVLGALHGFVWGPALVRARDEGGARATRLTRRVIFWARAELALALAIVFCGALLRMNPF